MTIREDILAMLRDSPDGLTYSQLAEQLDRPPKQVRAHCRTLASDGVVVLDREQGRRLVLVRLAQQSEAESGGTVMKPAPLVQQVARAWPHESVVQSLLVRALAADGWRITRVADTESQERGTDVVAERSGVRLLAEVKGYPGTTYARGPKAGQPKPTPPSLQAQHWYAVAVLKAMRLRGSEPADARIVIALPDFPRYRSLVRETATSLTACRIEAWLLSESGEVERC